MSDDKVNLIKITDAFVVLFFKLLFNV
jgi:hypothetical protein